MNHLDTFKNASGLEQSAVVLLGILCLFAFIALIVFVPFWPLFILNELFFTTPVAYGLASWIACCLFNFFVVRPIVS